MAVTVIHCADVHFDSPFGGLDSVEKAEIRREELRQAFGRIVSLAREEAADALLICGDLFDQMSASVQTLRYVRDKLASVPEIPVFISAGNHDPFTANSYYRILDWSENVHVFSAELERIEYEKFVIYGASFAAAEEPESKLSGFCAEPSDKPQIMALHADLEGSYHPIKKEEIAASGVDYLALGHIHQYSGAMRFGKTTAAYCGCPEGRGFDELGEKGVIKAVVDCGSAEISFVPIAKRHYRQIEIDVSGVADCEGLCGKILFAIEKNQEDLFKVVLEGEAEFLIRPAVLQAMIPAFQLKIKDETKPKVDYEALQKEYSLKGLFVKALSEQDADPALRQAALSYGLEALSGEKVKLS